MKRIAVIWIVLGPLVSACGTENGTTDPETPRDPDPVPTTVTVSPSTIELNALGATHQLTAVVHDQGGNTISGISVAWISAEIGVASVSNAGLVTASANGSATITATAAGVSGVATVSVDQEPASIQVTPGIFSADEFTTQTFQVVFADANGFAVPAVSFLVTADSGVGSVSPESGATNQNGAAAISWTFGGYSETETGIEAVTIVTVDGSVEHTSRVRAMPFSAVQCLDFEHSGFWLSAGGCGYGAASPGSTVNPIIRVTEPDYTPIVGATVTFEVDPTCLNGCDNPGSVLPISAVTDANGQATVDWTLGPNTGDNRLLVQYQGGAVGLWARGG